MTDPSKLCYAEDCDRRRYGHGLCRLHWSRMQRTGTLEAKPQYSTPEARIAGRSQWEGDCLIWTGAKDSTGYGSFSSKGKKVYVHRSAWESANGPIPEGHHIDHMCWNRACVNPDHLRAGTQGQNNQNYRSARSDSGTGVRGGYFSQEDREVDG